MMPMMNKFADLTLDVIGLCAFGFRFDCVLGGGGQESDAFNKILSANFNLVRRSIEELIPLLKLIPSKEREDLKKAEDMIYKVINDVSCMTIFVESQLMFLFCFSLKLHSMQFANMNKESLKLMINLLPETVLMSKLHISESVTGDRCEEEGDGNTSRGSD